MIQFTEYDTHLILSLKIEEMDFVKTPKASDAIYKIIEEKHFPNIIFDLENVIYIDSTGLSALINISRKIHENNSEMVVVCSSTKILQLFNIAKIDTFFKIFDSIPSAANYLSSKTAS